MSQNPLDNIRKRPEVVRRTFPNQVYEEELLAPARSGVSAELLDAAVQTHRARIVDLLEVRTIEKQDALSALDSLESGPDEEQPGLRPLEAVDMLLNQAGQGRTLLGTAPEEILATASRLVLRSRSLDLLHALVDLRAVLARLALGHLTTQITVTSNGQMVQPTTLAHFITAFLEPVDRSSIRLREAFARLNLSPLGAVSGMGTAIPARRERQAELLGFDGLVEHTFDALASADVEFELVSIVAGTALELSRLTADLAAWSRDDVGTIVPSEEFVHSGGAQPQRRDPLVLEHLSVRLSHLASMPASLAMLTLGKPMIPGPATRQQSFHLVDDSLNELRMCSGMLGQVLRSIEVNRALAANRAHKGFATSSELADLLAVDCELPRNQAYLLAERIATEATILALGGMTLDTKLVDRLALEVVGREVGIEPETLGKCLSAKRFIERREVPGGPAPRAVRTMIEQEHVRRAQLQGWLADRETAIANAEKELQAALDRIQS